MKKLAILFLLLSTVSASGHSWYPPECCHDRDCGPVENSFYLTDPKGGPDILWVTITIKGAYGQPDEKVTFPIPRDMKIQQSQDNQMHACAYKAIGMGVTPLCLFVPPGN